MRRVFFILLLLSFASFCLGDEDTNINADSATFDGNKIILTGNVEVLNDNYQIFSRSATLIKDEKKQSRIDFPWAELNDEVRATFYEQYFINCDQVNLDYIKQTLLFFGKEQVFFRDARRQIFADRARVEYLEIGGEFEVSRILLFGNVKMTAATMGRRGGFQYTLSDTAEYFPSKELILLKADKGKRVLYYDKEKDFSISADSIRAFIKGEGRELIEGVGDVRFIFKEEEIEKLKNRFEW